MASLYDRIGVDIGRRMKLEDGIEWAAATMSGTSTSSWTPAPTPFTSFDDARARGIREACERHGIHLGLHTLSAVNVAEYSPILSEAVDAYLKGYIDVYPKLGAKCIVVHAGYHFTADVEMRMAGRARPAEAHGRVRRDQGRGAAAREPEQGAGRTPRSTTSPTRSRSGATATTPSISPRSPCASPRTTRICCRTASRASSRDPDGTGRRGPPRRLPPQRLRGASGAGCRATWTSATCSGGSRRRASRATTWRPTARWTTCRRHAVPGGQGQAAGVAV